MPNKPVTLYLDHSAPPPVVPVSQGDTDWSFHFTVMFNGAVYAPNVSYVILTGNKPDGNVFAFTGSKSNNLFVVTPANVQLSAVAGAVPCELRLIASNGRSVGTGNFVLLVEPGPEGIVNVASSSALTAYVTILNQLQRIMEQAATIPGDVSGYISDWLEAHISGSQAVAVDNTLSVEGAAADAKATGDRLTALGDELAAFASNSVPSAIKAAIVALFKAAVYISPSQASNIRKLEKWAAGLPSKSDTESWASGVPYTLARITGEGASSSSGTIAPTSSYDRTDYGYCEGADYLYIPNEYNGSWAGAWFYDANKEYISPKITLGIYAPVPANAKYFVFYKSPSTFDTVANDIVPFDASDFEVGWSRGIAYSGLTLFPNQGLKYATGAIITTAGWSMTYYVNCEGVEYLKIPPAALNTSSDAVLYNWFYDSNKAPISRFAVSKTNDNYILVPESAKYFILNFTTACMEDIVEKGIIPYMAEDLEQ